MGTIIAQTEFRTPVDGWYEATIKSVDIVEGKYGPQLKWVFVIELPFDEAGAGGPTQVVGYSSTIFARGSRTYDWVDKAIFSGRGVPQDYNLNTDHLLRRRSPTPGAAPVLRTVDIRTERQQRGDRVFCKPVELAPAGAYSRATALGSDEPF